MPPPTDPKELGKLLLQIALSVLLGLLAWNAQSIEGRVSEMERAQGNSFARQAATDARFDQIMSEVTSIRGDIRELRQTLERERRP